MAKLVTGRSFSARTSAGWLCGARKPAIAAPGFILATRAASGGCTVKRRSAAASTASAPSARVASLYWVSGKRAAAPAPRSIRTLAPAPARRVATSGTIATRFSPRTVSFSTPIVTGIQFIP